MSEIKSYYYYYKSLGLHGEWLQLVLDWQDAVESLHQWYRLLHAHLDAMKNRRHLVDLLDLLGVLRKLLLSLSQVQVYRLDREVNLEEKSCTK